MTDPNKNRRILTDGGQEQKTVTKTVTAKDVVTREIDDEEREVLRVPISSTRQDREGDAFSEQALREAVDQIKTDQPLVFDDHGGGLFGPGYSARETIGTQFDAELEEDDDGHHTLYAYINPDHSHEEGTRMLAQVRDEKQAIKFSVGFRILETAEDLREDDRPDRANEVAGRLFTRTDQMETSRVGIPANPDASAGVTAKNGGMGGYAEHGMHPAFARMFGLTTAGDGRAPEVKTDGGKPESPLDELRSELSALRSEVAELRDGDGDDDEDDEDGEDDEDEDGESNNDDGGDGDSGEDDDEDEDEEEESSSEELAALRDEIREVRNALSGGVGTPESKDTDTTPETATPDTSRDDDPSETNDAEESTETSNQPKTALDYARGN